MNRETSIVLRLVFSLMVVGGIIVGLSGISANGVDCGSYFGGQSGTDRIIDNLDSLTEGDPADYVDYSGCEEKESTRGTITWTLILVGGLGNVLLLFARPKNQVAKASASGQPVAGWYPDPEDPKYLANWDGDEWVETDDRFPNK